MARTNYQFLIEQRIGTSIAEYQLSAKQAGKTDAEAVDELSALVGLPVPLRTYRNWLEENVERTYQLREPVAAG